MKIRTLKNYYKKYVNLGFVDQLSFFLFIKISF